MLLLLLAVWSNVPFVLIFKRNIFPLVHFESPIIETLVCSKLRCLHSQPSVPNWHMYYFYLLAMYTCVCKLKSQYNLRKNGAIFGTGSHHSCLMPVQVFRAQMVLKYGSTIWFDIILEQQPFAFKHQFWGFFFKASVQWYEQNLNSVPKIRSLKGLHSARNIWNSTGAEYRCILCTN